MRILVTGASGFIGSRVLPLLIEQGHEVTGLYNTNHRQSISGIDWRYTNLLNISHVNEILEETNPDCLMHFAWDVKPGYKDSFSNFKWLEAGYHLIKKFASLGTGKKAIIAGTCFEYDKEQLEKGFYIKKGFPLNPDTLYGASKASLYLLLNNTKFENNLSILWGRIFYLYGPNEHPSRLVPYLINSMLDDKPIIMNSNPYQQIPFIYVDDVAAAFVETIKVDHSEAFNICSNSCTSIEYLIEQIANLLDVQPTVSYPNGIEVTPPLLGETIFLNTIGFEQAVSLNRGLMRTINYWKEVRKNK